MCKVKKRKERIRQSNFKVNNDQEYYIPYGTHQTTDLRNTVNSKKDEYKKLTFKDMIIKPLKNKKQSEVMKLDIENGHIILKRHPPYLWVSS